MLTSRITEGENRNLTLNQCLVLVGLLTLKTLTLSFVWLLYLRYPDEQIERVIWWCWLCLS